MHNALILTQNNEFYQRYSPFLQQHGFLPRRVKSLDTYYREAETFPALLVVDNLYGGFDFVQLITFLDHKSPQTVVVNVHNGEAFQPGGGVYFYNLYGKTVDFDDVLDNLSLFFDRAKSRTDLSSLLLHDIRSPLNSMIAFLEMIQMDAGKSLTKEHRDYLQRASELGNQVFKMVEAVNDIYASEQFIFSLQKQPFNVAEIVEKVLQNFAAQLAEKKINTLIESEAVLPVSGDAFQIQRVLNNILQNAINYSKESASITVFIRNLSDKLIQIEIADNGGGYNSNDASKLFTKSFRGENSENSISGKGLGLFIAKMIVNAHAGKIEAKNNDENGLSILFTLPKQQNS